MDLRHLTGIELEKSTIEAVRMDRRATAIVLAHVKEVNNQKHYSSLGYRSPYDYLTRKHGYCPGSADRLIKASRLLASVPTAEMKLVRGEVNLTNLSMVQKFTAENGITDPMEKERILEQVKGKSRDEAEKFFFSILPDDRKKKPLEDIKFRLNEKEIRLSITVSDEFVPLLNRLKSLSGKNLSDGKLIELAVREVVENKEKRKFKQLKNSPSEEKDSPPAEKKSAPKKLAKSPKRQAIPRALQRKLYARAKYKCERCGSDYRLQINHKHPWSLGGEDSMENCNVLCFNCNDKDRIDAKLVRKGRTTEFL